MKKLLGIVVLGLLLSGNAFAQESSRIEWRCVGSQPYTMKDITIILDFKSKELIYEYTGTDNKKLYRNISEIISFDKDS